MKTLRVCTVLLARFFLSSLFLASAVSKIFHWQEEEQGLIEALGVWQSHVGFSEDLQFAFSALIPWSSSLVGMAVVFEGIGGLLVLLGMRERLGAALLLLVLLPATFVIHQFWFLDGPQRDLEATFFLKNLAIAGGLLFVCLHGAQANAGGGHFSSISLS